MHKFWVKLPTLQESRCNLACSQIDSGSSIFQVLSPMISTSRVRSISIPSLMTLLVYLERKDEFFYSVEFELMIYTSGNWITCVTSVRQTYTSALFQPIQREITEYSAEGCIQNQNYLWIIIKNDSMFPLIIIEYLILNIGI